MKSMNESKHNQIVLELAKKLVPSYVKSPSWAKELIFNWAKNILEKKNKTPDFLLENNPIKKWNHKYKECEFLIKLKKQYDVERTNLRASK